MVNSFFDPKSVAIVGASHKPGKIGNIIFKNFLESFDGTIYPINNHVDSVLGVQTYQNLDGLDVDLVVISTPANTVPSILKNMGENDIKNAIIISGGFSEVGNINLEQKISSISKSYGIRFIGPNCIGIYDPHTGVDTLFMPKYRLQRPRKGGISFISQSGAIGTAVLDWASMGGFGISRFVSYGNAVDINESDLIEYLANDDKTNVIVGYIESVANGRRFMDVVKQSSKPIVLLKGGVSSSGLNAAKSHTGRLASPFNTYMGVFKQIGVHGASTIDELFSIAKMYDMQPRKCGKSIAIITNGGGYGVLLSDAVDRYGLNLAQLSNNTLSKLREFLPSYAPISNPVDLIGDADHERYAKTLNLVVRDPNVDAIIVSVIFQTSVLRSEIVDVISNIARSTSKPIVVFSAGGEYTHTHLKMLESEGVPTFQDPRLVVKALKALI